MRIAVFGSFRDTDPKWQVRGSRDEFVEAARDVGRKFAHAGAHVIVGGMSERTADVHIVEGVVEIAGSNEGAAVRIQVIRPDDGASPYDGYARQYPHLFEFFSRSEGWWQGAHLISIRHADAVLTIGGGKGTYLAGLATIVARKPLVPIACFGGASERLAKTLESTIPETQAGALRKLNGPWSAHALQVALDLIGLGKAPRVLIVHGRSSDWLDLKDWLREEAGLDEIVVMGQVFGGGDTLPEKFERLAGGVDCAIAIATPDDVGRPQEASEIDVAERARQNVWVEVGWFWGRLGRNRLMVLKRGKIEVPSDLDGLELYTYLGRPREQADQIRRFLHSVKA